MMKPINIACSKNGTKPSAIDAIVEQSGSYSSQVIELLCWKRRQMHEQRIALHP
jgi:hypothetical protein